jgi:hypothetical protein
LIHSNELPSFQPGGYAARVLRIPAVTHVRFPNGAAGYRWFARPGFSLALFVSSYLLDAASFLLERAGEVFGGPTRKDEAPVDVKAMQAKIGQLALENDFLEGALIKAGMLSAKR